jgi:hypothetical protein
VRKKVKKMVGKGKGKGRPSSFVSIVDKGLANMYSIEHYDLAHHSNATLKDKATENWGVFTKGFSKGD